MNLLDETLDSVSSAKGRAIWPKIVRGRKSPKKNINDIHAMLMQLTEDEKKGLLGMQQTEMKKEEDF